MSDVVNPDGLIKTIHTSRRYNNIIEAYENRVAELEAEVERMNNLIHRIGNWIKDVDPETYVSDKQRIAELEAMLKSENNSNHRLSARELELEAEVERLREALTRISMMNDHNFRHGDLMNEAKAALEGKE
jgi:prefoldin subunit 5